MFGNIKKSNLRILFCVVAIMLFTQGIVYSLSEYDQANRLFVAGEYKNALEHYNKALASGEEFSRDALYMTAKCYEKLGKHDEVQKTYNTFLEKYSNSPKNANILHYFATRNLKKGMTAPQLETLMILDKIIINYPDYPELKKVYEKKINILIQLGTWADALELNEKFLKQDEKTNLDRYYFNLAEIYSNPKFHAHDYQKAMEFYKKVIKECPGSDLICNSYFSIGHIYKMTKDWQNAIKYYKRVSQDYPDDVLGILARTMVQICYIKRNEYLYATKSGNTLTKIFGSQNPSLKSLESGLLRDIEGESHVKLNIYADDSIKDPERAVYTGNVNIEKGNLKIYANKVDCDLKNKILYIKGNIRLINRKGMVIKGEKARFDVPKNLISASEKPKVVTLKNGQLIEKKGNEILLELDSGKILIDNVEYRGE